MHQHTQTSVLVIYSGCLDKKRVSTKFFALHFYILYYAECTEWWLQRSCIFSLHTSTTTLLVRLWYRNIVLKSTILYWSLLYINCLWYMSLQNNVPVPTGGNTWCYFTYWLHLVGPWSQSAPSHQFPASLAAAPQYPGWSGGSLGTCWAASHSGMPSLK